MSQTVAHDAGAFNRQLSLQNKVDAEDGYGGTIRTYEVQGSVWAKICPVAVRRVVEAANKSHEISHKITFRFKAGVCPGTRFTTGSRHFDVVTVRDPDETKRYLECEVVEQ